MTQDLNIWKLQKGNLNIICINFAVKHGFIFRCIDMWQNAGLNLVLDDLMEYHWLGYMNSHHSQFSISK